jgi:hypothetical protein
MDDGEDRNAQRRRTRKEVRHILVRKTVEAYLADPDVRASRRKKSQAVSEAKEGFEKQFGVVLDERTIYEALRPSSRSRRR